MSNNRELFEQLIQTFERADLPYCILAGYDEYPERIPSDIDFMIHPSWIDRLPNLIAETGAAVEAGLVQFLQHETTATYFVLARLQGATITYLHPDSSSDYRRRGKLWLNAEKILQHRRRHANGFWVPSPADAFAYYLIKKLDKGNLGPEQTAQLTARYAEDPRGCARALLTLLPKFEAGIIQTAVCTPTYFHETNWSAVWADVIEDLPRLRRALHAKAEPVPLIKRIQHTMTNLQRILARCRQPTGLRIVFLGPDGSGKSTVINAVTQQLSQAFRQVEYRHLRPGKLPQGVSKNAAHADDPHGRQQRGQLGSIAKLLYFWGSYQIGSLIWLYPRYLRSTLVIFDRYYQDLLADPTRYRYSASIKLARLLGRWLPQPDLVFILDAPAEVLQSRKQEVPFAESARQRNAYRALASEFRQAHVIDTNKPLDQVVATVLSHTIVFLERRATKRLGLTTTKMAFNLCKH
ncbi:MAG TPA: hypothetical protein VFF74_05275 [Methylophilaceae bacterium]|nr:hypothetical protein [Methylophilaceae bacterium]